MDTFGYRDEILMNIHAAMEMHGWAIVMLNGDRRGPARAHTIGMMDRFTHPELVVLGLSSAAAGPFLAGMVQVIDQGARFEPGSVLSIVDLLVRVDAVHDERWDEDLIPCWFAYYDGIGRFPPRGAVQLLWSDEAGRFLGQRGFDPRQKPLQRILSRAPARRRR